MGASWISQMLPFCCFGKLEVGRFFGTLPHEDMEHFAFHEGKPILLFTAL